MRSRRLARTLAPLLAAASVALALFAGAAPAAAADPDEFSFDRMDVRFELDRDAAGRSLLETTETLVARFPEFDQNHGIRRAIPTHYNGTPTDFELLEVSDETGAALDYELEHSDGFAVITIADEAFVHGQQHYVIRYRQHNVTLRTDAGWEFYWDVNGTGWPQPFGEVTASLGFGEGLSELISAPPSCYQGPEGGGEPCEVTADDRGLRFTGRELGPFETVTLNVPFRAEAFTERDNSLWASPFTLPALAVLGALGLLAALAWLLRLARWRDHPGRGIIVAEYDWPAGLDVFDAAERWGVPRRALPALVLKLAVAGLAVVREAGPKEFELNRLEQPRPVGRKRLALRELSAAEQTVRDELFAAGPIRRLRAKDAKLPSLLLRQRSEARQRAIESGRRHRPDRGLRALLFVLAALGGAAGVLLAVAILDDDRGGAWPALFAVAGVALAAAIFLACLVRPLTAAGRAERDHLAALREFLTVTEAERIARLQGPGSAERDAAGRLDLYESLLPAAIILGVDRKWSGVVAELYGATAAGPDWYDGSGAFTPALLSGTLSGISSNIAWSQAASAAEASGAGGGGSSGGGGGGGGGGGV